MKTSPNRSYSVIENERFGLVFAKTGSIFSGTVNYELQIWPFEEDMNKPEEQNESRNCRSKVVSISVSFLPLSQSIPVSDRDCLSLSKFVCLWFSLSVFDSVCLCLSLSQSLFMFVSVLILSLPQTGSISANPSLILSLSLSQSVTVWVCLWFSLSLSQSVSVSVCLCLSLSLSQSVSVSVCPCLSLSLSMSVSVFILSPSQPVSVSISLSLSMSPPVLV